MKEQQAKLILAEEYLQTHAPFLPMFEQSQSIVTDLNAVLSSHSRISIYEKQIVELFRQQPAQEQERTNKENDFNLKSKENQIRQQEINQLNAQLDSMNRSALQEKKSTLETIKENLQKAQNALIVLEDKKAALATAEENEKSLETNLQAGKNRNGKLKNEFDTQKKAYDDLKELYDKQKEAVEEWAKEARARLSIGDMCPVCGQKIEVLSKDEDFQSMLAPIRQSLEAKEKEYKEAEQALNSNRAEVKTYENMIANSRLATEKTRKGHDLARTKAEEQCSRCSISSISDNTKEILEKLFQENKLNLENVNAKLNEVQTLSNHISRLQHLKDNHQKAVEAARNALDTADKNLTKLKTISPISIHWQKVKKIVRTTLERVSPLILWEGWQTEWQTSPTAFIERLQKSAEHYKLAQNRQAELKAAIALIDKELSSISATQELICTAFPEWRDLTAKEKWKSRIWEWRGIR